MANPIQPRFQSDSAISFTCAEPVLAGQLVERRAGTRLVGVAGAGSTTVAGVAQHDVPAVRRFPGGPQVGDGNELTVLRGVVAPVTYAADATPGVDLIAAAGGQVTPAGAAPDARTLVGDAFEAVSAGSVGLAVVDD